MARDEYIDQMNNRMQLFRKRDQQIENVNN